MTGGDVQMRADIATYGWHVIKVLEDDEGPACRPYAAGQSYDILEG